MKLLKPTTLAIFGIGFLAGSRAGRKPWDTVQGKVSELQHRGNGDPYASGVRNLNTPTTAPMKDGTLTEF